MSADFDDTTDCPHCGSENAYFNGYKYDCPDCGCEWDEDGTGEEGFYFDELEKMEKKEKELRRREKSFVFNKIDRNALKKLFSPDWKVFKWNEIYGKMEEGLEENYYNLVLETMATTNNFNDVKSLKYSDQLEKEKKDVIMENVIKVYLESRDELPLFPKIDDWALFINAPVSYIKNIIPKEHVNFKQFMPLSQLCYEDFAILFHKRIEELYNNLMGYEDDLSNEISLPIIEETFSNITCGGKIGSNYPVSWIIERTLNKHFENEFEAIKKYRSDLETENGFDKYIAIAKEKQMTLSETIIFILEDYLKEII